MSVKRLRGIPGFSIDRVAAAAGSDPEVLRLENLDTDLRPPASAIRVTREAVGRDDDNSYLPFNGRIELREAVAARIRTDTGCDVDPAHVVITCGATEGMLDALLALTDPGDEVILTDPTYAGMIYRVRLAGAVPVLVPFRPIDGAWRLDLDAMRSAITASTRLIFLINPAMPSGAVLTAEEWSEVGRLCDQHDLLLLYNAAFERIVFDGADVLHPLSFASLADRTVTIGSVSKEYRMIGWRIGWVTGPEALIGDIARVHIYNAVTPPGISQIGAAAALGEPRSDLDDALSEWQRRRNVLDEQLAGHSVISARGGWSQLLDVSPFGLDSFAASSLLMERGRIAATPMRDWGIVNGDQFVRLVFSNEPVGRLAEIGERVRRSFS